jgi:3-oxoacyl-[acyl-carrier protein] reductase
MSAPRLAGKVAVISGAGRGIGAAIAAAYAREGARVVCAARSEDQIAAVAGRIREQGGEALAVVCDVTELAAVRAMYEQAAEAFGGVDIVVVNAGGSIERKRVDEGSAERWIATIELNLNGAYFTMREAIPHLKRRGAGKIISVGSGMGHRGTAGNSAYAASKAGLWSLTRVLAQELVEFNISVNELIPGPVRTELTRDIDAKAEQTGAPTPFLTKGEWVKTPEDVTGLALFMATLPDVGPTAQSFSLMRRDG